MAVVSKQAVASFDTYAESVNQFGELVITATKGATTYQQTVPVQAPSTIFWDSSNGNFFAIPLTIDPMQSGHFDSISRIVLLTQSAITSGLFVVMGLPSESRGNDVGWAFASSYRRGNSRLAFSPALAKTVKAAKRTEVGIASFPDSISRIGKPCGFITP